MSLITVRIFRLSGRAGSRLRTLFTSLITLSCVVCGSSVNAEQMERDALRVGVFPYLSTRAMLSTYEPMRDYLESALRRPVRIYTAASYRDYYQQSINGVYDVAIFPPHLALLAQKDGGQMPIARFSRAMHGIFVTPAASPIMSLEQLRGMQLATPDSLALVTMLGVNQLTALGMQPQRDYSWRPGVSHNSALLNIQRGGAQVALVANSALDQMPPAQRGNLRVLGRTEEFPSLVIMTRKNLSPAARAAVRAALLEWHLQPGGERQLEILRFEDIVPLLPTDLEPFNVYLNATREALRKSADEAARR